MPRLPISVIIAATVILLGCLVAVVVIVTTHNNSSEIISFITTAIIPTFVSLFVLSRVEQVAQKTDDINKNVNGNLSALIEKVPVHDPEKGNDK
jgi:hypothetical protein